MKCWRCGSVDLKPYAEEDIFDDEGGAVELLVCRACDLLMSEGEPT